MNRTRCSIVLAACGLGLAVLAVADRPLTRGEVGASTAEARVGRPATPMSYAGVARRTTRRAAAVGAAGAAAYYAYPGYPSGSCYQTVDAYGNVITHCP